MDEIDENMTIPIPEAVEEEEKIYPSTRAEIESELKDELKLKRGELKGKKLPATLTREECKTLIQFYKKGKLGPRNRLILRLLYATGMRIDELTNLRFADIFYDNRTIFVREGKGNKDRYVCVDDRTLEMLHRFQEHEGKKISDPVFDIGLRQIRRVVEKAGSKTGISAKYEAMGRYFSPHSLRHSFATHSFENGMRTFTLKKLLGHEYLGTTEIYLYCSTRYDEEEYRRTNPVREI